MNKSETNQDCKNRRADNVSGKTLRRIFKKKKKKKGFAYFVGVLFISVHFAAVLVFHIARNVCFAVVATTKALTTSFLT